MHCYQHSKTYPVMVSITFTELSLLPYLANIMHLTFYTDSRLNFQQQVPQLCQVICTVSSLLLLSAKSWYSMWTPAFRNENDNEDNTCDSHSTVLTSPPQHKWYNMASMIASLCANNSIMCGTQVTAVFCVICHPHTWLHSLSLSLSHTHTHARTHARMHACTHTRTHAHMQYHTLQTEYLTRTLSFYWVRLDIFYHPKWLFSFQLSHWESSINKSSWQNTFVFLFIIITAN